MNILLFGATGMIGQGVLRQALADPEVTEIRAVLRRPTGQHHPKLKEILHADFLDVAALTDAFTEVDACLYCLGVSSAGMGEAAYGRITYDATLAAAERLVQLNPAMTFLYVSGVGTDSTGQGRVMWARIKGRTENALLGLGFAGAYMVRPGAIQPLHGTVSGTRLYRLLYAVMAPLWPLLKRLFPTQILTTEQLGRAMLAVAKHGAPRAILEPPDLNRLALT